MLLLAAVRSKGLQVRVAPHMGGEILANCVTTTYVGGSRVRVSAGERFFEADQRTELDRPGAGFCPLELVAAALGA